MKKLFALLIIVFAVPSYAQDNQSQSFYSDEAVNLNSLAKVIEKGESLLQFKPGMSLEEMHKVYDAYHAYMAENITATIYALPKVYWQYIVPSLFVYNLIPEEVTENPDFLEYKGKKPTLIADRWKKYAEKYLDDLHPSMYIHLAPENIEEQDLVINNTHDFVAQVKSLEFPQEYPHKFFMENQPTSKLVDAAFASVPSEKYSSGKFLEEKPDTERSDEITPENPLRGGDVLEFVATLPKVADIAKEDLQYKLKEKLASTARKNKDSDSYVPPCEKFISGLEDGSHKKIKSVLETYDFSPSTWAQVCDRTIKAHRLYGMSLRELEAIYDMVYKKSKLKNAYNLTPETEKIMQEEVSEIENLYNGNPKDIPAVKWYMDEINRAFNKNEMNLYLQTSL